MGSSRRRPPSDADADAAAIHAAAARTKAMSASYREAAARRAAQQPAQKTCASILRRIFSLPHQTAERREQAVNFEEMQAAATAALEKTASEAQATAQLAKEKATEMLRSSEAFIAEMDKANSCAKWTAERAATIRRSNS